MLRAESLVKIDRLRDKVSVELVKLGIEKSSKVLGEVIRLLKAWAKTISKGSDIGDVSIFTDLRLFFDVSLKFSVAITA